MAHQGQAISNPRTGLRMTFVEMTEDVLRIDSFNPADVDEREPLHTHPRQESAAEVSSGELVFEVEGDRRMVGPGESIMIPAGAVHRFWNEGDEDAHSIQTFRPALKTAAFFELLFQLADEDELDARGMPKLLQLAVMVPEYGDEIRPAKPPWPVLRVLTAVLGPIARARGYRPRPAAAPPGTIDG
jgi:mannose-6-phosphate isomerase-like protein (cupin superfamily)